MFACLCKPNSVCHAVALAEVDPPSPYQTMDGPSSPRLRRDKVVIYLGPRLLDILLGLKRLKPIRSIGIRSCTEVRILPFHPNVSIGLFPKPARRIVLAGNSFSFELDVTARTSHVTVDGNYPLPCSYILSMVHTATFDIFVWQQRKKQQ